MDCKNSKIVVLLYKKSAKMMKSPKIRLLTLLLLVSLLPCAGQGLTKLGRAPEISVGQFPNGITYYLVTNKAAYGYADYALVQKGSVKGGDDARNAQWYPINEIPQLAFDHEKILRVALKHLKERIHFQPIGFELLPEVFTMPQLQALYEAILEVHFDRRNFANKMLKLGILEETGDRPKNAARTVPVQYRFNPDKYKEMKSKGFRLEF